MTLCKFYKNFIYLFLLKTAESTSTNIAMMLSNSPFPSLIPGLSHPGLLSTHFKHSVTSSTWGLLLTAITPCTMARQGVLFPSHILGWMLSWNQIMWKWTDNRWSLSWLIGGCEYLVKSESFNKLTYTVHIQIHKKQTCLIPSTIGLLGYFLKVKYVQGLFLFSQQQLVLKRCSRCQWTDHKIHPTLTWTHYFQIISSVQLVLCEFSICSNKSNETVSYEIISLMAFPALTNCQEWVHLKVITNTCFTDSLVCPKPPQSFAIELPWWMSGLNANSM